MNKEREFLFGINPVLEKLRASPHDIAEILLARGSSGPALRGVDAQARRLGIRVKYLSPYVLNQLAEGQRHQGVLAKVIAYAYRSFNDLLKEISANSGSVWVLILDGLTDPRNFGALLRSAEAVGVHHVVIPKDRAVAVTPTVVKASAGAAHYLKIYRTTNLRRAIADLKELGLWIVGLDAEAPEVIYDRAYPARLGVVLGSEGGGIRPLILKECDFLASVPMGGNVTSLNVAVAGAVFLYELVRQARSH
ncbi:MAG TPA: 23S rRNA (guanosine(2251)-2'-O)-methyltransferase RlmB [Candidatus Binatia bacterium]|nr:23S rRNA (guanosine(2251)-2'-O)-methyltransferase RlmB [Candidatus Binatia bacterium]